MREPSKLWARWRTTTLCAALAVAGCGDDGGARDAGSGETDSGGAAVDAGGPSADAAGGEDAGVAADAGAADDASADAGASREDAGASEDAAVAHDAASSPDAGPPAPTACTADAMCAPGASCITGLCFEVTTTTDATPMIGSIERMVAGADADGTLRLVTVDAADRSYDVVGRPGAFTVTPGGTASDTLALRETGRAGTAVAHASFASADERWILADQVATVREDRPIYGFDVAHAADGTMHVITTPLVPRRPSELYDPYPLHLWTRTGTVWSSEELVRNTGIDRDLHLRHDSSGRPEVLYTDTFWIKRWRLELAGWESTIVHTLAPVPTRAGTSLWIDDDSGHTHLLHVLHTSAGLELAYVELDDTGPVREAAIDGAGVTSLLGSLSFDDAGQLYFLSLGDTTSPNRRPLSLHRIATDGVERRTLLGTVRTDFMQWAALAVAPDGTVTVMIHAPAQPMEIRTLAPR